MPKDSKWQTVVIGSGLSGAAVKQFLNRDDTLVIERAPTAGGLSKLEKVFGCEVNVAGVNHLRIPKEDMPLMKALFEALGLSSLLDKPGSNPDYSAVWLNGKIIGHPVQLHLWELPFVMRLRCLWDAFVQKLSKRKTPASFQEWAIQRLGRTVANQVILPHTFKSYQISPALLDWRGIIDRVIEPSPFWQSLRTLLWKVRPQRENEISYPLKSLSCLVKPMLEKSRGEIWTDSEVVSKGIDTKARSIDIRHPDGCVETVFFENLCSTIALPGMVNLLKDVPDDISLAKSYLDYTMMCVTVLAFEGECPVKVRKLYVPSPQFSFQRLTFPKNFDPESCPDGRYLVNAESYYPKGKKSLVTHHLFKKSIIEKTVKELEQLGLFNAKKIIGAKVFFINPAHILSDQHYMMNRLRLINFFNDCGIHLCGYFAEWSERTAVATIRRAWEVAGCPDFEGEVGWQSE